MTMKYMHLVEVPKKSLSDSNPAGQGGGVESGLSLDLNPTELGGAAALADRGQVKVLVTAVVRVAEDWRMKDRDAAALFGVLPETWHQMKEGTYEDVLDTDMVTRASLIIGLFGDLRSLFCGPLTSGWPTTSNDGPGFDGKTPVELMIDGGIPAMVRVRQHIAALRGVA